MMGTRFAIVATVIALAVAEEKPSDVCGADWICSPLKREVCGEATDGTQTTRNNKCEAHCFGEDVEREGPCLADLQARFDACLKFKDQETACGSVEGCFFTPKYREAESAYGYDDEFVPEDIALGAACYEVGANNATACVAAVNKDDEQQCMWQTFGTDTGGAGSNGECIDFDKCVDAAKKGKVGCEAAGCEYTESDGYCNDPDFSQLEIGEFPNDETSCKSASGKWQVFAKCELARDDDMGGGANTDYNNGGSDNDSVQNDMSTGGDDFDVDSLAGTKKWQDACDYALTDTQCTDVEHEGKNAEEGDKGCTWTEGASSGYCGPEGDDTDAETQQKCFAVSDDFETNDAQKKSQCNLMSTPDKDGCAWAATEAQGSCQRYDLCEKYNENENACDLNGCKFYERQEFQQPDSQQCYASFSSDDALETDDITSESNDECGKIENVANCNAKTNEVTGASICVYKFSSNGECLVKDSADGEYCNCYSEDCEGADGDWPQTADLCNAITKDDNGNACEFDDSAKFGQCMTIQCYDMATSTKCGGMDGCTWVESSDYDDYCASEMDENSLAGDDMVTGGDDASAGGQGCYAYSAPDKISKCTAENKCAVSTFKTQVCDGKEDAEDAVKEACQQYEFSKAECEENQCVFSVKESKSCDDAVSCRRGDEDLGGGESTCEAIRDDEDNALCQWEAIQGSDTVSGYCQEKIEGSAGESQNVNGTCGLDQQRRGDENAAGGYTSYGNAYGGGSYGSNDGGSYGGDGGSYGGYEEQTFDEFGCAGVNMSDTTDRVTCDLLRDDDGFQRCNLQNQTVEAMVCRHPVRNFMGSGEPPADVKAANEVDCYLGDTFSETDCTDLTGCHFEDMACKCVNPDELPALASDGGYGGGSYGGDDGGAYAAAYGGNSYGNSYSSYGGGGDDPTPVTQYQCDAAPEAAECEWVEAGTCACEDQPEDESVNTYLFSKKECADSLLTCQWYGQESCVAKVDSCEFARSEGECTTGVLKARGCAYTEPVIEYKCNEAVVSDTDRCARFSDSSQCDQQTGCRMQESIDQEQEDMEELLNGSGMSNGTFAGGEGNGVEIFFDCFELAEKATCDGAVRTDAESGIEVKKCAWAQNVYSACTAKDDANEEAFECYNKGTKTECLAVEGDLCDHEETVEVQCIAFDACSIRKANSTYCEKLNGCAYEGAEAMEQGFCQPKGLSEGEGNGSEEDNGEGAPPAGGTNEGEGPSGPGSPGTGGGDGGGGGGGGGNEDAGQECFGKGRSDCPDTCEWVSMGEDEEDAEAVCYADFSNDDGSVEGADPNQGGAPSQSDDSIMDMSLDCFARTANQTFCTAEEESICSPTEKEDSPDSEECAKETKNTACLLAGCLMKVTKKCSWFQVSQQRNCVPELDDASAEKFSECGSVSGLESEKCAGTSGCKIVAETFPPQCLPMMAQNTGGGGASGPGDTDNTEEGGGPADGENGADNGFFEMESDECFRDPFACCNNHFDEDSCGKRNDAAGDSMCAFIKGEDYSYCGGALCNQNLTLGATAITCGKIGGCQWVNNPGQDFCTFKDKCSGQNKTACDAIDSCQYGDESSTDMGTGVDGEGDSSNDAAGDNSNGRCDVADTSGSASDDDKCTEKYDEDGCKGTSSCKWYADDMVSQEPGFCAPSGPDPCDDQVGSRSWNRTACDEVDACQWKKGGGGGGGGGVSAGDDDAEANFDYNCQRKEDEGGEANAETGDGSGFSDGLTFGANSCFDHDTTAECRRPLDDQGKPTCSWVVIKEAGFDRGMCTEYNKCGVATKKECQENECSWVEKFDFNKGGTEGACAHPPSTFDDGTGNYTCLPDFGGGGYTSYTSYTSYGDDGDDGDDYTGGGLFFGDDLEHVETTTSTRTVTTVTTKTRTATTTTFTTTTVTHVTEQPTNAPDSNDVPITDENGDVVNGEAPTSVTNVDFFDNDNYAVDITFGTNFYTQLDDGQKRDVQVKTQQTLQIRMEKADIYKGKFKKATAHGYKARRGRRNVAGTLIVRVEFNSGILPSEMNALTASIITQPIQFKVYGLNVNFASTFVSVITKTTPMSFPAQQTADQILDQVDDYFNEVTEAPAGLSAAELQAKAKADKLKKEAKAALDAKVAEAEKCVDKEGNTLDDNDCAEVKSEGEEANEKKEATLVGCTSNTGEPMPETFDCSLITEADGKAKVAKQKYIGCLGDLDNSIADCAPAKAAYETAKGALASVSGNQAEVDQDAVDEAEDAAKKKNTTTIIIVIVVVMLALIAAVVIYVCNHHAYDDVYGTAGMASYNNPVYGGAAPAGADGGYLGAGNSTEYGAKPAKKKGGLVRQESMC